MQQPQQAWEQIYRNCSQHDTWPKDMIISLTRHYFQPADKPRRVLELGCANGDNIPFFMSLGWQYCAVEGFDALCDAVRSRWSGAAVDVVCGDFTKALPFEGTFDLVLEKSELMRNDTPSIRRCLKLVNRLLKPREGLMFSLQWFSEKWLSTLTDRRTKVDEHTCKFKEGPFKCLGIFIKPPLSIFGNSLRILKCWRCRKLPARICCRQRTQVILF